MDFEFIGEIIKVIFSLGIILILLFISLKISNGKFNNINKRKNMIILDKIQVAKDVSICIIKILDKAYVVSVSSKNVEKIQELTHEELMEIEKNKKEEFEKMQSTYTDFVNKSKKILNKYMKRKESNEK